jgi:hypothetical protein
MLGIKDQLGYNFEIVETKPEIEKAGLSQFMVYCNSSNPYLWKRKKGKGVDKVFHIGRFRVYVEQRFHSHFYHMRTSWFQNSTMQRMQPYPHTKNDIHVVNPNRTDVYDSVQLMAQEFDVKIMTTEELIDLLNKLVEQAKAEGFSNPHVVNSNVVNSLSVVNSIVVSNNSLTNNKNVYASTVNNQSVNDQIDYNNPVMRLIRSIVLRNIHEQSLKEHGL